MLCDDQFRHGRLHLQRIVSRHLITRSASPLGRSSLAAFGDNGNFTRDLFQTDIAPQALMTFRDPFPATFRLTSVAVRGTKVTLGWETFQGYAYRDQQTPDAVNQ